MALRDKMRQLEKRLAEHQKADQLSDPRSAAEFGLDILMMQMSMPCGPADSPRAVQREQEAQTLRLQLEEATQTGDLTKVIWPAWMHVDHQPAFWPTDLWRNNRLPAQQPQQEEPWS